MRSHDYVAVITLQQMIKTNKEAVTTLNLPPVVNKEKKNLILY